jgi:cysteinyl-tRNA synthetase
MPTSIPIRLHNTLSRRVEDFTPLDASCVSMYSCGPTVYNYAHIGNMRAFLFADLLHRVLRVVGGYDVRWVMNITDIDDKTIRDSARGSEAWLPEIGEQTNDAKQNLRMLTDFYGSAFIHDLDLLRVRQDGFFAVPRATDFIPQMQTLIRAIAAKGYAYERGGSVYFNVGAWRKVEKYGKLFTIDEENFQEGVRIDADEYERESVSDFVLWKAQKPDEPAWDFEFNGKNVVGRPGWHIECSAMEHEILGLPFDIHTGGIDLCFPHHEDEIAQSKAGYGIDPTVYWCHNEFLEVEGEKMSKSKGNFFTLRDLVERGIDPVDVRWLMFSVQYSSRLNFTFAGLEAGRKARLRLQDYIFDLWEHVHSLIPASSQREKESEENFKQQSFLEPSPLGRGQGEGKYAIQLRTLVFTALANDLQTPKALAELFTFINHNPASSIAPDDAAELLTFFRELDGIFDAWQFAARTVQITEVPESVAALAEERVKAKKARNFAEADRLRAEITAHGFVLKDTKEGYALEKA